MDSSNTDDSDPMMQRLAEFKADNHTASRAHIVAINEAMTPAWRASIGARIDGLSRAASSARSKLPKLYRLMEEFGELRAPHVACKAGCSACCRTIPVEISALEARHIAAATGQVCADLPPGRHSQLGFLSTPCPFLVNDQCSIYEHRPYSCRSLAVVDRDAVTCSELNTKLTVAKDPRAVQVMMTKMSMFDAPYRKLTDRAENVWADIRQFFPQPASGRVDAADGKK